MEEGKSPVKPPCREDSSPEQGGISACMLRKTKKHYPPFFRVI
jgi:hypothetical protein